MWLSRFQAVNIYMKTWGKLAKFWGFFVPAVGLLAALIAIHEAFFSGPSAGERLRLEAAECRSEGYEFLKKNRKQDRRIDAGISFRCAEQKFADAIAAKDKLALWGLANLLGDETVHEFLPNPETRNFLDESAMYWCKARLASVPEAAFSPPFIKNLQC